MAFLAFLQFDGWSVQFDEDNCRLMFQRIASCESDLEDLFRRAKGSDHSAVLNLCIPVFRTYFTYDLWLILLSTCFYNGCHNFDGIHLQLTSNGSHIVSEMASEDPD